MMIVGYNGEDDADLFSEAVFKAYAQTQEYLFGVGVPGGFEGTLMEEINGIDRATQVFQKQGKLVLAYKTDTAKRNLRNNAALLEDEFNSLRLPLLAAQHYFEYLAEAVYKPDSGSSRVGNYFDSRLVPNTGRALISNLERKFGAFRSQIRQSLFDSVEEIYKAADYGGYQPILRARVASLQSTRDETNKLLAKIVSAFQQTDKKLREL